MTQGEYDMMNRALDCRLANIQAHLRRIETPQNNDAFLGVVGGTIVGMIFWGLVAWVLL